jgi:hypothetical protein
MVLRSDLSEQSKFANLTHSWKVVGLFIGSWNRSEVLPLVGIAEPRIGTPLPSERVI